MRQASLVAFYGAKPPRLESFLRRCQNQIHEVLHERAAGIGFRAYAVEQIHATVIGLERQARSGLANRNFQAVRGCSKVMRLPRLFEFLVNCSYLPFEAQFGGFGDRDWPFQSRGARPYARSFSLQGTIPVAIGWPCRAEIAGGGRPLGGTASSSARTRVYPRVLEDLRRSAERFNVLHRWHREPSDADNDLYLRLGRLERELPGPQREWLEGRIRRALSAAPPLIVRLAVSDLMVVSRPADDETLAQARSRVVPLADPRLQDKDFIAALYD
ncbi:MAG: hypothetical protein ACREIR_08735 [Geminicoccaceae bacterium]